MKSLRQATKIQQHETAMYGRNARNTKEEDKRRREKNNAATALSDSIDLLLARRFLLLTPALHQSTLLLLNPDRHLLGNPSEPRHAVDGHKNTIRRFKRLPAIRKRNAPKQHTTTKKAKGQRLASRACPSVCVNCVLFLFFQILCYTYGDASGSFSFLSSCVSCVASLRCFSKKVGDFNRKHKAKKESGAMLPSLLIPSPYCCC